MKVPNRLVLRRPCAALLWDQITHKPIRHRTAIVLDLLPRVKDEFRGLLNEAESNGSQTD